MGPRVGHRVTDRKSKYSLALDREAIYAAVHVIHDIVGVKRIAGRVGGSASLWYKRADRNDREHRPPLEQQILRQRAALEEGAPWHEACAELICEADHLGADVIPREDASGARRGLVSTASACMESVGAALHSALEAIDPDSADGDQVSEAELADFKQLWHQTIRDLHLLDKYMEARAGNNRPRRVC